MTNAAQPAPAPALHVGQRVRRYADGNAPIVYVVVEVSRNGHPAIADERFPTWHTLVGASSVYPA